MNYNDVLNFIKRRWGSTNAHWIDGNCYWFAAILCLRFSFLEIYYLPVDGHFVAGDGEKFFNWMGIYEPETGTQVYKLSDIKKFDDLWYSHLMRDCRD